MMDAISHNSLNMVSLSLYHRDGSIRKTCCLVVKYLKAPPAWSIAA